MAEVNWIKITTDMFDNRKIKYIRKLPEGNNIVLIWVMLLTMAGRCNSGGMIFLTENVPYTVDMLAAELGFEQKTVELAIGVLSKLDMVVSNENYFAIAGWEEHQNVDGMKKIREQTRLRVQNHRERQKALCNATSNATVTQCNAIDKEEEKERDKEIKKENSIREKRHFEVPSVSDIEDYIKEKSLHFVDANAFWNFYDSKNWMVGKTKMTNWKSAVSGWNARHKAEHDEKNIVKGRSFEPDDFFQAALEASKRRADETLG